MTRSGLERVAPLNTGENPKLLNTASHPACGFSCVAPGGSPNAAIDYLTSYLNTSPPDAVTLTLLGKLYVDSGKPALALDQFQKAAALAPNDLSLKAMITAWKTGAGAKNQGLEELEDLFVTDAGEAATGPLLVLDELGFFRVSFENESRTGSRRGLR